MTNDARGQALIETMLLGLLFMAPLLWGLGVLADLHRTALAASSAAREAGFEAARSVNITGARGSAERAVVRAFADHDLDPSNARVKWAFQRLERGEPIEVVVSYPVPVLQAPFIGRVSGPSVWVHAKSVARIDPYRSRN
jgi:hypothetical protein